MIIAPRFMTPTACRSPQKPVSTYFGSWRTPSSFRCRRSPRSRRRALDSCSARASSAISRISRTSTSGGPARGSSRRAIGAPERWSWWRSRPGAKRNDNIVAFWRPAQSPGPGSPAEFAYRIIWLAEPALPKSLGKVVATRAGASLDGKRRVFILDFVGAGRENATVCASMLGASSGKISNAALVSNGAIHGLRASFELDPNDADLIELRLRVMRGDQPVTETWLYRWTAPLSSAVDLEHSGASGGMPPEAPLGMPLSGPELRSRRVIECAAVRRRPSSSRGSSCSS